MNAHLQLWDDLWRLLALFHEETGVQPFQIDRLDPDTFTTLMNGHCSERAFRIAADFCRSVGGDSPHTWSEAQHAMKGFFKGIALHKNVPCRLMRVVLEWHIVSEALPTLVPLIRRHLGGCKFCRKYIFETIVGKPFGR